MNYPNFNGMNNKTLQAYNRLNIIYNIKQTMGNVPAVRYAKQFNKGAKKAILVMQQHVDDVGYSTVRREIIRGLV